MAEETKYNLPEYKSDKKSYTPDELKLIEKACSLDICKSIGEIFNGDRELSCGIFYTHLIQQMCRSIRYDIPTAAVSVTNSINLYINPIFWMYELPTRRARNLVLVHEVLHVVFHHCSRHKDFQDHKKANVAFDLVVNSQLEKKLLGDHAEKYMFPSNFNLPENESANYYYTNFPMDDFKICNHPHEHDQQYNDSKGDQNQEGSEGEGEGEDSGGEGSNKPGGKKSGKKPGKGDKDSKDNKGGEGGQGNDPTDKGSIDKKGKCKVCGGHRTLDDHSTWGESSDDSKVSDSMKESVVNDAVLRAAEAAQKLAGNLPQAIRDQIELAKQKPQIPWQTLLRRFISQISAGMLKYTKKRESKRFGTRPGVKIKSKLKLCISLDCSGSISDEIFQLFMNEVYAIRKNDCEIEVVEWDTEIHSKNKKGEKDSFPLPSGYKFTRCCSGGTDINDFVNWSRQPKNKSRFDGCIVLTDGYLFSSLEKRIGMPAMFVITADGDDKLVKDDYMTIKLPK